MSALVPDTDREKLYDRWYELRNLYLGAIRQNAPEVEVAATKTLVDDAWDAYTGNVTERMREVLGDQLGRRG
jgi:hypothetical protein